MLALSYQVAVSFYFFGDAGGFRELLELVKVLIENMYAHVVPRTRL